MANTIAAGLNNDIIKQGALQGFVDALLPLAAFSFDVSPMAGERGASVSVGLISAQTAGDFAGSYKTDPDSTVGSVQVTMNVHKFKTVHLTDTQLANSSVLKLEDLGYQAGHAVGVAFVADILSVVTAANYGVAVHTGLASAFDSDDVVDIRTALNAAKVPMTGRKLVLDGDYIGALLKDDTIKTVANLGSAEAIRDGMFTKLSGMNVYESDVIPANGENLVGFAGNGSGIAVAMRYLEPQGGHTYSVAEPLVDNETGLVLGVREFYDNDTGTKYLTFEALGGKAVGIADGLKRIVSA